jgi:hypothetical protein
MLHSSAREIQRTPDNRSWDARFLRALRAGATPKEIAHYRRVTPSQVVDGIWRAIAAAREELTATQAKKDKNREIFDKRLHGASYAELAHQYVTTPERICKAVKRHVAMLQAKGLPIPELPDLRRAEDRLRHAEGRRIASNSTPFRRDRTAERAVGAPASVGWAMAQLPHTSTETALADEIARCLYTAFGLAEKEAAKRVSATYAKDDEQFSVTVHGADSGLASRLTLNFGGRTVLEEVDHYRHRQVITTVDSQTAAAGGDIVTQEGKGHALARFPLTTLSEPNASAARKRVPAIATVVVPLVRDYGRWSIAGCSDILKAPVPPARGTEFPSPWRISHPAMP